MYGISRGASATVLSSIPEEEPASGIGATGPAPALERPSLRAEIQQWVNKWRALGQGCMRTASGPDPFSLAMEGWCEHLAYVAEQAAQLEAQGDQDGAARVIADFPSIAWGCCKILAQAHRPESVRFVNARTTLMQRLVRNEFAQQLRALRDPHELRELNQTISWLCASDHPAPGTQWLKEMAWQLRIPDPTRFNEPPPRPPMHPSRAEPQRHAHR